MFCNNCGKELPDGSEFCPYCMKKFKETPVSKPIEERKSNSKAVIIALAAVVVVLVVVLAIVIPKLGNDRTEIDAGADTPKTSDTTSSTDSEAQTSSSTSSTEKSTETTESKKDQEIKKRLMTDAYIGLLDTKLLTADIFNHICSYTVYDMNSDGVYELIINTDVGDGDYDSFFGTEVYTFQDNKVVCLGKIGAWWNSMWEFHMAKDGGILLYGENLLLQVKLSGNSVVYNSLPETDDVYNYSAGILPQSESLMYSENGNSLVEEVMERGFSAVQREFEINWTL